MNKALCSQDKNAEVFPLKAMYEMAGLISDELHWAAV